MEPALEVTVVVRDAGLRREIRELRVVAGAGLGGGRELLIDTERPYAIEAGVLDDGRTSFVVRPGPRAEGGFFATVHITALDASKQPVATNDEINERPCSGDACNFAEVELVGGQQLVDGRAETSGRDMSSTDTRPADRAPDRPVDARQQLKTCSAAGVTFTSSAPLKACATIDLTVSSGSPYEWVLATVKDALGQGLWVPPDSFNITCCPHTWPFPGLKLPCAGAVPPFSFSFMKDATDDNPVVGTVVATCTP
jgi:hypothetical protein